MPPILGAIVRIAWYTAVRSCHSIASFLVSLALVLLHVGEYPHPIPMLHLMGSCSLPTSWRIQVKTSVALTLYALNFKHYFNSLLYNKST